MQARLRHQQEQTGGFERHSFTAGVRASDDNHPRWPTQPQVGWHNFLGINQWMSSIDQRDFSVGMRVIGGGRLVDQGRRGSQRNAVFGFGKSKIQFRRRRNARDYCCAVVGDAIRQCRQNALHFFAFGQLGFAPGIIKFHRRQWFNVQRRARSRLVVDDAAQHPTLRRFDRHNIAPIAHGDDRFLQSGGKLGRIED